MTYDQYDEHITTHWLGTIVSVVEIDSWKTWKDTVQVTINYVDEIVVLKKNHKQLILDEKSYIVLQLIKCSSNILLK